MTDQYSSAESARLGSAFGILLRSMRAPVLWGAVWGALQAVSPIGFWWLPPATVYGLGLILIAAVYIGFAVADGRPKVIAVESAIAAAFVVVAAAAVTGPALLLVVGLAGHGLKDAWQEHTQFVANTRWWPPFCATVDWVAALILSGRDRCRRSVPLTAASAAAMPHPASSRRRVRRS